MSDAFSGTLHPKAQVVRGDGNGVRALYKPCDVLSMPNGNRINPKSLLRLPYDSKERCYIFPDGRKFFLLNRLDAPTSGLLIGCFDENVAHSVRQCFFAQEVRKTYYALTAYGKIPREGTFRDVLEERHKGNYLRVVRGRGEIGEIAVTRYSVEKELNLGEIPLLKLCLQPLTGRTHQLRVQCAWRKLPIIGDKIYGDFALNGKLWTVLPEKRLYLQSCAIEFSYKIQGKKYFFAAQIPCEFSNISPG
ncbi:MAG: RNA pseudouridine synthase [Puniceicoccales bacterium]|jgi:23S rRNA-/tRNA-specific pseudouridylate synthase|nr:RNA pseudouridine synthase [Puniceicoccales bacterium]